MRLFKRKGKLLSDTIVIRIDGVDMTIPELIADYRFIKEKCKALQSGMLCPSCHGSGIVPF